MSGWRIGTAGGDHLRVSFWGRAYPGGLTGRDWACLDVSLRVGGGSLRFPMFIRGKELHAFSRSLAELRSGAASRAQLMPRDPWLVVTIDRAEEGYRAEVTGRGHASAQVLQWTHPMPSAELDELVAGVAKISDSVGAA